MEKAGKGICGPYQLGKQTRAALTYWYCLYGEVCGNHNAHLRLSEDRLKYEAMISAECYTFKPLNLHMLSS
jgi:hypothetical protein